MSFSPKLLLIIFILTYCICHPKAERLRELTLRNENGVIEINKAMFEEYIESHPRPYDFVILFTSRKNCPLCERVYNEFVQVSDSFRINMGFKPDIPGRKRAVFFGVLYHSQETMEIFTKLKFPSLTTILYTSPHTVQIDNQGKAYIQYDEEYIISYNERSDKIYALKMMEFANAKSQRKFPLKKNLSEFMLYFVLFVILIFAGFSLYKSCQPLLLSPILWTIGSFLISIICIGGVVYNVLHGTPFAKYDREGNIVEFIHSGQRAQYVGEGILMSSLFVFGGTALYAFKWINTVKGYWRHKAACLMLIFTIFLIMNIIVSIYRIKARWYSPTFLPPGHYVKGPLINDQGNSF